MPDTATQLPADDTQDIATELAALGITRGPDVAAEHSHGAQYTTRVRLKKPITRASAEMEPIAALYLREPDAGDLRGVKLGNLAQFDAGELITLLPRIAMPRLSPQEAASIGLRDTLSIGNAVASFLD